MEMLAHVSTQGDVARLWILLREGGSADGFANPWACWPQFLRDCISTLVLPARSVRVYNADYSPNAPLQARSYSPEEFATDYLPSPALTQSTCLFGVHPAQVASTEPIKRLRFGAFSLALELLEYSHTVLVTSFVDTPDSADPWLFVPSNKLASTLERLGRFCADRSVPFTLTEEMRIAREFWGRGLNPPNALVADSLPRLNVISDSLP